jgi:hypothetical protein
MISNPTLDGNVLSICYSETISAVRKKSRESCRENEILRNSLPKNFVNRRLTVAGSPAKRAAAEKQDTAEGADLQKLLEVLGWEHYIQRQIIPNSLEGNVEDSAGNNAKQDDRFGNLAGSRRLSGPTTPKSLRNRGPTDHSNRRPIKFISPTESPFFASACHGCLQSCPRWSIFGRPTILAA